MTKKKPLTEDELMNLLSDYLEYVKPKRLQINNTLWLIVDMLTKNFKITPKSDNVEFSSLQRLVMDYTIHKQKKESEC